MKQKIRIDDLTVNRGFARDINHARALIIEGRVLINNIPVTKPGTIINTDVTISLKEKNPYVSRGGLKLEQALSHFKLSVKNKICMDVGASTGGFTDCLLQHGAKKVYAIDVGKNQLDYILRQNPCVVNFEGINFRYFSPNSLKEPAEFVTIDVSFISIVKILKVIVNFVISNSDILALVKPQFELKHREVIKGVVKNNDKRLEAVKSVKEKICEFRLKIAGEMDCQTKGPKGNIERFLWLKY